MSTFSSILSSIGSQSKTPQQSSTGQNPNSTAQALNRPNASSNVEGQVPKPTGAGVKRKSEEPEPNSRPKVAKLAANTARQDGSAPTNSSRFQLSTKPAGHTAPPKALSRTNSSSMLASSQHRSPQSSTSGPQKNVAASRSEKPAPVKRSFASIMEKAKAAAEDAKNAGSGTIKHKPAPKLTKRERRRIMEAAKAEQAAGKRRAGTLEGNNKNGRPRLSSPSSGGEMNNKVPLRKAPEPLAYKGTMRSGDSGDALNKKRKGEPQDKYGGYASWSDLDDAEDEEDDYGSDASSDMEGGFDDVEREELLAMRAARKEDQEAMEEEERHRREKMERKRRLMELNESAKARKKY